THELKKNDRCPQPAWVRGYCERRLLPSSSRSSRGVADIQAYPFLDPNARSSHDTGTQHALQFWCIVSGVMRYLVKARVKSGQELALVQAIDEGTLGQGSIAGDEYLEDCNRIPIRLGQRGARNDDFTFKSATEMRSRMV